MSKRKRHYDGKTEIHKQRVDVKKWTEFKVIANELNVDIGTLLEKAIDNLIKNYNKFKTTKEKE